MSNNATKTDAAMKTLNSLDGFYSQPMGKFAEHLAYNEDDGTYDVTLRLPADQIGGNGDVRSIMQCIDALKMVPILVFVDPSELPDSNAS